MTKTTTFLRAATVTSSSSSSLSAAASSQVAATVPKNSKFLSCLAPSVTSSGATSTSSFLQPPMLPTKKTLAPTTMRSTTKSDTISTSTTNEWALPQKKDIHSKQQEQINHIEEEEDDGNNSPPLLLLECDDFYVSKDGICRTYYQLLTSTSDCSSDSRTRSSTSKTNTTFAIEELNNIEKAHKQYILRSETDKNNKKYPKNDRNKSYPYDGDGIVQQQGNNNDDDDVITLGPIEESFHIQEIDHGVLGTAGTGSATWESSIAMVLYFSIHPELLKGHVLELGSGVGLGGILTHLIGTTNNANNNSMESMTLSDHSNEVIEQCLKNVYTNTRNNNNNNDNHATTSSPLLLNVCNLDWYEPNKITYPHNHQQQQPPKQKTEQKFDTIIACDCAYRYQDIKALANAMIQLLKNDDGNGNVQDDTTSTTTTTTTTTNTIHIFGPYNRGAIYDLIQVFKDDNTMNMAMDFIELERYRLKPLYKQQQEKEKRREKKKPKTNGHFYDSSSSTCKPFQKVESFAKQREEEECAYASKSPIKFLHIAVSLKKDSNKYDYPNDMNNDNCKERKVEDNQYMNNANKKQNNDTIITTVGNGRSIRSYLEDID